jgi:hypothetical protein
MRANVSSVPVPLDDKYSWQILRGKDGTHATAWALRAAQVGSLLCFADASTAHCGVPLNVLLQHHCCELHLSGQLWYRTF